MATDDRDLLTLTLRPYGWTVSGPDRGWKHESGLILRRLSHSTCRVFDPQTGRGRTFIATGTATPAIDLAAQVAHADLKKISHNVT